MSSSKDYKDYVLEQLSLLDGISVRPMMGEFLLYLNGLLFGGIYDDNLLVKRVENNKKYEHQGIWIMDKRKPMRVDIEVGASNDNVFEVISRLIKDCIKKINPNDNSTLNISIKHKHKGGRRHSCCK